MIAIDDETGGTRLTPSKCCGQWDEVKRFPMTANSCVKWRWNWNATPGRLSKRRT